MSRMKHEMHEKKAEHHARGGHHVEDEKMEPKRVKRAKGGAITDDIGEEVDRGHRKASVMRKRGGKVEGSEPKARMDRRARGGRTSEDNPTTQAGKMKDPSFVKGNGPSEMGRDMDGD